MQRVKLFLSRDVQWDTIGHSDTMTAGGWRGHPNSIKALKEQGIHSFEHLRKCSKCRNPAVTGYPVCRMHGGVSKRPPSPERLRMKAAQNIIRRAMKDGLVPVELTSHPVWFACSRRKFWHLKPMLLAAWLSANSGAWAEILPGVEALIQEAASAPKA